MFRNRSYMLGLGTGIILGCLLLVLMQAAEQGEERLLGFEDSGGTPAAQEGKQYTEEALQALLAEEAERVRAELAEQATAVHELETAEGAAKAEEEAVADAKPLQRVVRIQSGTTLQKTAGILEDYGLIDNRLQFMARMKEAGAKIRRGTFYFEGMPDEDEVMQIITGPPITLD
ncbi:hypothetical protein PA598K_00259 [Paenibacillus sp. 598K]|uniref:hypothetical protein n=1 Tax=Paenibacillus sp. 598K TaxID=1117987 RepID=UPI000FF96059|nr:hypothetical protein [Paenibacillus sp. 598K]GBF72028.1 hypothetical protein PA598K_00259 [Paenibacillus sp. 598K]